MIRLLPMLVVTVTIVFALVNVAGGATWVVDDDGQDAIHHWLKDI